MNERAWQAILTILGGVIAGLIGFFTGWLLNRLQRASERKISVENRRREFLAFMAQLDGETRAERDLKEFRSFYSGKIPNLKHASSFVCEDFSTEIRIEFEKLISKTSNVQKGKSDYDQRNDFLEHIKSIIDFTKKHLV